MSSAMRIVVSMSSGSWVGLDLYGMLSVEDDIVEGAWLVKHDFLFKMSCAS